MSSYSKVLIAALAAAPALVSAHGHVNKITVNGESFPGFANGGQATADTVGWATTVQDNGFVESKELANPDIICHKGATAAKASVPVAAGDAVTIQWDTWPESHVGPIIDYLAACPDDDCSSVDKESLEFFKINEGGLLDSSEFRGRWVTDELIENNFAYTMTIPKDIAPGSYVLRHEIIALHEGQNPGGAQMYPQCINLEISGSGTSKPKGVKGTALYTETEEGIVFDPYRTDFTYPIPGPALISGGGEGSAPPASGGDEEETPAEPKPTSTLATSVRPSATASTSATAAPTTTAPANPPATNPGNGNGSGNDSDVNAVYAQCGGKNFSGSKACAQGSKCTVMNEYYSQCIPEAEAANVGKGSPCKN